MTAFPFCFTFIVWTVVEYRKHFGMDYYGFWYGGLRCLVINSCLMMNPAAIPEVAHAQDVWLEEEIEQAKLCAQQVMVFSHHPWFLHSVDEDEGDSGYWIIPKKTRDRWFKMLRHKKVTALFAGHYHRNVVAMPFPKKGKGAAAAVELSDVKLQESDVEGGSDDNDDDYKINEEDVVNPLEVR
jgi:hypothetical protein